MTSRRFLIHELECVTFQINTINFREWAGLQTLHLDHNYLTEVDPCWTSIVWSLQTIHLEGNPIICSCNLKHLKLFGTETQFPRAQCASPDDLAGQFVDEITPEQYNCSEFPQVEELTAQCHSQCVIDTSLQLQSLAISGALVHYASGCIFPLVGLVFMCSKLLNLQ